jgi:hypothetical protein
MPQPSLVTSNPKQIPGGEELGGQPLRGVGDVEGY